MGGERWRVGPCVLVERASGVSKSNMGYFGVVVGVDARVGTAVGDSVVDCMLEGMRE